MNSTFEKNHGEVLIFWEVFKKLFSSFKFLLLFLFLLEVVFFTFFFWKKKNFFTFLFWKKQNPYIKRNNFFSDYGDARWLSEGEMGSLFLPWKTPFKINQGFVVRNINVDQDVIKVSVKEKVHHLIIGATGSGKTQRIIIPTIWLNSQASDKPNFVVSDVKGEISTLLKSFLEKNNYSVFVFNLRMPLLSNAWNPLSVIYSSFKKYVSFKKTKQKHEELFHLNSFHILVNDLCESLFTDKSEKNKFWNQSAMDVVKAIIFYLFELAEKKNFTIEENYFNLANVALIASNWKVFWEKISKFPLSSISRNLAFSVFDGSKETAGSIMQVVNNALRCFREELIKMISSQNEISFKTLFCQTSPFAIFLIIPDESKERNVFARIFVSQLYRSAVNFASFQSDQKLSKTLYFILDEFSNFAKISNFSEMITVSRSRNIFFQLVVQSFSQLVKNYGQETANIIFSNCALHTFLQTLDFETAKKYEMMIGEETILNKNFTKNTRNVDETSSSTTTISGKKLITASELMRLKNNSALIFLDRNYPSIVKLKPFFKWNSGYILKKIVSENCSSKQSFLATKKVFDFNFLEEQEKDEKRLLKEELKAFFEKD